MNNEPLRRALVATRALRPLRLVNKIDGLRKIYSSLTMALKDVTALLGVIMLFWMGTAILGMQVGGTRPPTCTRARLTTHPPTHSPTHPPTYPSISTIHPSSSIHPSIIAPEMLFTTACRGSVPSLGCILGHHPCGINHASQFEHPPIHDPSLPRFSVIHSPSAVGLRAPITILLISLSSSSTKTTNILLRPYPNVLPQRHPPTPYPNALP